MNQKYDKILIEIHDDEIVFPKGYFFKVSPIHKTRKIPSTEISEINLNIFPPIIIYNDKEMIFIKSELESELKDFAIRNKIEINNRFDIWAYINKPFLDTEFDDDDNLRSKKLLAENGILETELISIRKKAGRTMFLNFLAWEWVYLGLFTYLDWTFLTKKKYWWAMEIALRNYKD